MNNFEQEIRDIYLNTNPPQNQREWFIIFVNMSRDKKSAALIDKTGLVYANNKTKGLMLVAEDDTDVESALDSLVRQFRLLVDHKLVTRK